MEHLMNGAAVADGRDQFRIAGGRRPVRVQDGRPLHTVGDDRMRAGGRQPRVRGAHSLDAGPGREPQDVPLTRRAFRISPARSFLRSTLLGPLGEIGERGLAVLGSDRLAVVRVRLSGRRQQHPQRNIPGVHVTEQEDPQVRRDRQIRGAQLLKPLRTGFGQVAAQRRQAEFFAVRFAAQPRSHRRPRRSVPRPRPR
jgi:hypothetical protein